MSRETVERVYRYHDGTKHHFHRFAPALGFLDWASQPRSFRSFDGAPTVSLYPAPDAPPPRVELPRVSYDQLFGESVDVRLKADATKVSAPAIGYFLRHAVGLSAWKVFRSARWSLRVNPSSGNLHPTEAYIVTGPLGDFADTPGVWHYAADRHAIERRCAFDHDAWRMAGAGGATDAFFVALSSIHWRESWKYGERAFRYCQHDLGHAIAALRLSAALCGWRLTILPAWPHRAIATLVGLDRDEDYVEAEREEPACLMLVTNREPHGPAVAVLPEGTAGFLDAVRRGRWFGRASQLSEDHVTWTFIDDVARATEDVGRDDASRELRSGRLQPAVERPPEGGRYAVNGPSFADRGLDARAILLQRRSAVALDGLSSTDRAQFFRMLSRVMPGPGAPWDAIWWTPRIHVALFVHRVEGLQPGLYLLARAASVVPRLQAAFGRDFRWEPVVDGLPLWLLESGDYTLRSKRVSCDQDIAADGFFSLGMIADFEASLDEDDQGPSFYRQLFWESGVVGQVLYLEAEAAGARATGIGCFYDDPVHELLGLKGHAFQSLYHFTAGIPVEDRRLTTQPGYAWEGQ